MVAHSLPIPERSSFLIVAYGNSLRGDDGIGQAVAAEVEQWNLPQVEVKSLHQLTPELAENLARIEYAIFVDACVLEYSKTVKVEMIQPDGEIAVSLGHALNPRVVLALSLALYGRAPDSWLISVPGANFELGDCLSPIATAGVQSALEQIEHLVNSFRHCLHSS
ncbi:MAG: hydrogenase maturation protease [Actinomycetota bacterium]